MLFVFQRTAGRPTWRIEKCAGPGKRGEQQRIGLGLWHRQPFHQHRNPFLRPSPPSECIGKPPTRKQVAWCEAQNPPVMGSRGFPLTTGIVCVAVGFLPTQVNRRNQVTDVVSTAWGILSRKTTVPVLPESLSNARGWRGEDAVVSTVKPRISRNSDPLAFQV